MIAHANGAAARLPIEFAADYVGAGLSVVPIAPNGSKQPCVAWKRFQTARAELGQLRSLFSSEDRGVAIIHGAVSGGTEAVDLDDASLLNPFVEALDHAAPGLYQRLCVVQTPRGFHVYYRCPQVEGNQKLAMRPPTAAEVAEAEASGERIGPKTLIETRGEGGYTIAPGSPGACHPSGLEYAHLEGPPLTALETLTPAERAAVFMAARTLDRMPAPEPLSGPSGAASRVAGGESPGDAYAKATSWAAILEPHGWVRVGDSGDKSLWRRPGKSDGVSATTGNVSKAGAELLCVFSTNAHPFTGPTGSAPCSSHGKFDAYARLNHGGDHAAAAKELARLGFGDRPRVEYADPAMRDLDPSAPPVDAQPRRPIRKATLGELVQLHPRLNPPVVDGLFRAGETVNIVAPTKVGKSWLAYSLLLSLTENRPWLDTFEVSSGRVLLIDNELHPSLIASRISRVAEAMQLPWASYQQNIDVWSLRGDLRSLQGLAADFAEIQPGDYQAILLDAKYRFAEQGVSENDNAAETLIYNQLDRFATQTGAAVVLIHHSTKGGQSDKRVTDVGAGAGAQSRAADCHMVLREHEEPGVFVLDAAVRSFPPVPPVALRWEWPLWRVASGFDPEQLKGRGSSADQRAAERDKRSAERSEADALKVLSAMRGLGRAETTGIIRGASGLPSSERTSAALGALLSRELVEVAKVVRTNGQVYSGYQLTPKGSGEDEE